MAKRETSFSKIARVLIITTTVVVIGLLVWKYRGNEEIRLVSNNSNVEQQATIISKQDYILDTENDGVYTDYKYGIRFKYPSDVFKYQTGAEEIEESIHVYWDNSEDGASYVGGNLEGAYIDFHVNNAGISKKGTVHRFRDIYSHPVGASNPREEPVEFESNKLKELPVKDGLGMISISTDPRSTESGRAVYSAAWLKGDNTYWLTLVSNSRDKYGSYKMSFDNIVASFAFIK
jgi:hypothetical protein